MKNGKIQVGFVGVGNISGILKILPICSRKSKLSVFATL